MICTDAQVDFHLLGPLSVVVNGRDVTPRRPQQRRLLTMLLLRAGHVVSTDALLETIWGEAAPPTARTALQGHVSALRKLLGSTAIETQPSGYVLRVPPDQIDLARFEAIVDEGRRESDPRRRAELLCSALALFRGEPVAEFRYEQFAHDDVVRIEELRVSALEQRIDADLEAGRHGELVPELVNLVTAHPLREHLRAQLMVALYRCGRQNEALDTYQRGRQQLAAELGIDPGPELQQLERRILTHDPSLAPTPVAAPTPQPHRPERRLVTVLVADVVAGGAGPLDPEDYGAFVAPCVDHVRAQIERFGGCVQGLLGDIVVGVFGATIAHEDDAERAVRAALASCDSLHDTCAPRIGIATGRAIVTRDARSGEPAVSGDVVESASCLLQGAPSRGVLVSELTARLTDHVVDFLAPVSVTERGEGSALLAWQASGVRTDTRRPRPTAAFIGRSRELEQLVGALARAEEESAAHLVTILGEPGIGKSRLLAEFHDRVIGAGAPVRWLQGRSLPYADGVTCWALGEVVKAHAGIYESDRPEIATDKLRGAVDAALAGRGESAWVLDRVRPLVGLESDDAAGSDTREEAAAAWRLLLRAIAEQAPLIVAFEDLHWADEILLDFVETLPRETVNATMLVVCTARPELLDRRPGWGGGQRNTATFSLTGLADRDAVALLRTLLVGAEPSAELIAKAGGNPLYAEEYARLVNEGRGPADLGIPASLEALIAARLDLLPAAEKALLQDAAVVGERAWAGAVAAVGGHQLAAVDGLTHRLERKDYLARCRESSVEGEVEYAFSHVLVRDVAYESIPRSARGEKHRLAAAWIESLGRCQDHAELLAAHYVRALELARVTSRDIDDLVPPARRALAAAGERAGSLGGYAAASRHFERALELCPDDDPEHAQLLLRYARTIFLIDHDEAIAGAVDRARRALVESGDVEGTAQLDVMLGELSAERGDAGTAISLLGRAAEALADRPTSRAKAETYIVNAAYRALLGAGGSRPYAELGLDMAEQLGALDLRAAAHDRLGIAWLSSGDVDASLHHAEQSLRLTEGLVAPARVRATGNLASLLGDLGELGRSRRLHERCLELATALGAHRDVRWSTAELAIDRYFAGEWDDATTALDTYLGDSVSEPYMMDASCFATRARMRAARGDAGPAMADVAASIAIGRRDGGGQTFSFAVPFGARFSAETDPAAAAEMIDEVLGSIEGERWIWAPACLVDLAYALRALHREHELASTTAAAYPTKWLAAARAIAAGAFVEAAHVFDDIGSRPDAALARLYAGEQLVAARETSAAAGQLDGALAFWRSVEATAYIDAAEALLEAMHRR